MKIETEENLKSISHFLIGAVLPSVALGMLFGFWYGVLLFGLMVFVHNYILVP